MLNIPRTIINRYFSFSTTANSKLFILAGQGTQQLGMFDALNQGLKQKTIDKVKQIINIDLGQVAKTDSMGLINETQVTQPLVLMSHYLHFEVEKEKRKLEKSDIMIGHSLGQYSALVCAKSLSFQNGISLVHQRGKLMKKYTKSPHGMLITKYKIQKHQYLIEEIKKLNLEVAALNTRTSLIIAGQIDKIAELSKKLKNNKIFSVQLPVSTGFHCRMLSQMKDEFYEILRKTDFESPFCKVVRNFDCKTYETAYDIREGLMLQLTNPVLFYNSVKQIDKAIPYEQIGHKHWISRFVHQIRDEQ